MAIASIQDRIALVTGAGSGIGKAIAELFSAEGATVVATDLNKDSLAWTESHESPGKVFALRHDVTVANDWAHALAFAGDLGGLHILVNNAGIMLDTPFAEAPIEDLRLQYKINVEGPYLGTQMAIPLLTKSFASSGFTSSVINISSIFGQVAGDRYAAYCASKGAVLTLTRAIAVELADKGVRVNSVLPGPTATNLNASHAQQLDSNGVPIPVKDALEGWASRIPMKRIGNVDDIAPLVAFLASEAARYITGAEFVVDGGYSIV